MKTLSEKLRDKIGSLARRASCKKKKTLTLNWTLDNDKLLRCPECSNKVENKVLVSI